MTLKDLREKVNLLIYDSKPKVLRFLSALNILVSLTAISTLVYYYGFELTEYSEDLSFKILEFTF